MYDTAGIPEDRREYIDDENVTGCLLLKVPGTWIPVVK